MSLNILTAERTLYYMDPPPLSSQGVKILVLITGARE